MRKSYVLLLAVTAFAGTAPAASACDLEGFGFTRVNPFGLNASWGVPQDHQQSQLPSTRQAASAQNARQNAPARTDQANNATDPAAASQRAERAPQTPPGFVPVSAEAAASQSRRFTATKD
ncbi:hypothetical protein [Blastomonas fulva]|uniref:Uncharacterized protein n=1 Tax=Blastomonas fulva TaxID=1550728 RepID=A0ABM6M2R7_9SPHN|nr:hypothetical protein [Blastomonas fulva]ASR50178.1 hypothetical protein B5J99_00740 [Blastomonas fulva]